MGKIIDQDGVEHEVFTPDEVVKEREAAIEQFKIENPVSKEVDGLKVQLEEKDKEITALKSKGDNNAAARRLIEEKEAEKTALKTEMEGKITDMKKYVDDKEVKMIIKRITSNDIELTKKIEEHMKTSVKAMPDETEEQRLAKVEAAYKLSTNAAVPGVLDNIGSGGGMGGDLGDLGGGGENQPSTALKDFAKRNFNITEDDWKKYGGKKYEKLSKDN